MAKVNLALLGGFRLQTEPGEAVPLSTKKAGALLAYLALHPGQPQARTKLATLFWGDRSEVQARDSLRQALSLMRKALSRVDPGALIAHEDTISFKPTALTIDAIVFGDLAAHEEIESLEQAIALYGGELLDGFEVAAPEFESWLTAERERFREMALEAMTRLLDHHLSSGAVEGGIRIAARLLAADPLQERVHRTLMELYCRQGRHGAALRQYRTCADLLAKELGIDPDATTKAMRREILSEWNQLKGAILGGDAATKSLDEVDETEAPTMPRWPERRQVTVLACDLVGTSELAVRLDLEELRALIATYQRCCMPIIARSGGVVGKLSGTGMLAYFGYPQAHEHDIECAVRAGLTLVEAVSQLDGNSAGSFQLRAGIATGPVVVGDLLGSGADQQMIIGEAVQLAGALERIAEPNTVLIAASTRRLVGNLFDCDDLGQMVLNGFSEPVPAWRVKGTSGIDSRFEALRAPTTPLIGRDEELELLLRRWRQAKNGGRVVLLSGEPGIGKSRLTVELQERVRGEPHIRLRYSCSPHHQDNTLYPIINELQGTAGFRRDDTDAQRLDRLEAVLARSTDDFSEAAPLIADLLSVPSGGRYAHLDLTPQKRKEKTLRVLLAQLEGLAARQPVLVVFEDVHWIDPTSLELLDLIVDRVSTIPALVIITCRPEFAPSWVGRPQVTWLTLNRLPRAQRAEMIAAVTGGKALPLEITDQIIDRADGVPLFIEELTKMAVESGLLIEAKDRDALTGPPAARSIPSTLQGSLLARLDRLPETREVAQIGAALGRSFSHELISAAGQMPQQQVDAALERLVSAELIFRRGFPPDAEYTFKHALVQDAAYGTLSRTRRQLLHARIIKTLQEQFPDTVAVQPALLAYHCEQAGSIGKAISYRRKAGELALARSAMTEAEVQLRKGLGLLANLPEGPERHHKELRLQALLGVVLCAAQGWGAPSAGEAFDRARELCAAMDQTDWLPHMIMGQFAHRLYRAELRSAYQLCDELLTLGKTWKNSRAPSPTLRLTREAIMWLGHFSKAHSRLWLGELAAARAGAEEALRLYDPAGLDVASFGKRWTNDVRIAVLSVSIESLTYLGYLDQARRRRDEALARAHQIKHAGSMGFILSCIAGCEAHTETDPAIRLDHVRELETFCVQHGFTHWENSAKWQRACCLMALGHTAEAIELQADAGAELCTTGSYLHKPTRLMSLAEALGKAGRPKEGLKELEEAANEIEVTEERWAESNLHRIRGELLIAIGELTGAEASFRQAIEIGRCQSAKLWELRAATCLARLWRDQGSRARAHDLLAPISDWFTEGLDTPVLKEARALLEQTTD
ncbi:BTAD domain-containing putative transcriptional regulator [Bradyrhizobium quebecense]|uniref:AAA family ATPase n=2 Tax=Bradyrhizobium quebecense TaxID=2748629 RepID=A0ACD3VC29_9BRAD|nr:BTAD domain-containing putative transcriptional regulator [Bradyrhizobium quebecense]UGY03919.1 AAA family ATPase [Bradyrhizobium quebecense]